MRAHPRFRQDLLVFDHREGGTKRSIVLKDPISEKFFRLSPYEFSMLKELDGTRSLEETLQRLRDQGRYYSPEDARGILEKAAGLGLVLGTRFGTAEYQRSVGERVKRVGRTKRFSSVYFLFIPLINPDRFLDASLWVFRLFFNRLTAVLTVLLAPGAIYLVVAGLPRIEGEYLYFFNWKNLLYLWVVIFVTKLTHELAHAFTAKRYGLNVPEMGVAFLIFFPCLYCNTTDAWQLADRRQRIAISGAGIAAEAVLAILAAYVWYFSKPGMINSLAFYLMAVSFVSTLLFNGNPLMKFDGYFILIDLLRIPNLAAKSLGYIRYLFMNHVLGVSSVSSTARNSREIPIFALYGVSAFIYRVFLYGGIIIGVYYRFDKTVGVALALMAFLLFVLRPVWNGSAVLYNARGQIRPRLVGSLVFVTLVGLLIYGSLVPFAGRSIYPCYLDSARKQKLTVPLQTRVREVRIREGDVVREGTLLFSLDTSPLELSLSLKRGEKQAIEREIDLLLVDDKRRAEAVGKAIEMLQIEHEIQQIHKELQAARTDIVAPFDGAVTTLDYRLQEGFQPGEGVIVGELQSPVDCVVHGLVPEEDLRKVRTGQLVSIRFPIGTGLTVSGVIERVAAYSERDLQDSPFSSRVGGEVATEVRSEDRKDAPLEAWYRCSIAFPNDVYRIPLGMTGSLVVPSPPQSMASRLWRRVVTTFNKESLF